MSISARATWRFVLSHPAHFLSFGFGAGLSGIAPGTMGTLVAFPVYAYLKSWFGQSDWLFLAFIGQLFLLGIWLCGKTGKDLGEEDHSGIVFDEIVAFMMVLFFTPQGFFWQAGAFLLFRFFDVLKPPPIAYYDRMLRGGFGVMFDDLLAAFYALICLALFKSFLG